MLPKNFKICILCPFYNEESNIVAMYGELSRSGLPYTFVNDGSTDLSMPILEDIKRKTKDFKILSYPKNRGKGYAIKFGANELIKAGVEYILIMDVDRQFSMKDIPIFLNALKIHPNAKIIIGNRLHSPKNMPIIRLWANILISWLISCISGKKVIDSQCGFKLIHKSVFSLNLTANKFDFESEVLIKAGKRGMEIVSVPIKCIYYPDRESKIKPIIDTIRFFKMLWRLI